MKLSLRWKVLILILSLTTTIILAMSYLILNRQTNELIESVKKSADRESKSVGFLSARAILDQDDFVIIDTVNNIKDLEGLKYGAVYNKFTSAVVAEVLPGKNEEENKILRKMLAEKFPLRLQELEKKPSADVSFEIIKNPAQKGNQLYIFQRGIYNTLIKENPPLMGIVQLSYSDSFIEEKISQQRNILIFTGLIFWVIAVAGALGLAQVIVKPVRILSEGAKIVGEGNLEHKVPELGKDEIGDLAKQFNEMTAGLLKAQQETANKAILDEQISQAKEIQEGMNPSKFLKKEHFQIKGYTRAAKGVGGDYYDFMTLEDGRVVIIVSDVSGKGISASLVMVLLKTVVTTYIRLMGNFIRPNKILETVNRVMCSQAHIDKFATFLLCILHPETGEIEFSNGGHGPLYIYRAKDHIFTQTKLEGLPMGIDEDSHYQMAKTKLNPGDLLVMFTDGVNEAWNENKEEYGLEKLIPIIIKNSEMNAKELVEHVVTDIDAFAKNAKEQHDDLTLLVLKYL